MFGTLAVLLLVGCGGSAGGETADPDDTAADERIFGHVHGLGVDPADDTLYVASHLGVFRVTDGQVERVADRWMDAMGFVVVGEGHFLASGHPDPEENMAPSLGLVESTDAGETWQPLSLLGEADLHSIEVTGDRTYAYESNSQSLIVTEDRQRWDFIAQLLALRDIATNPEDPDAVYVVADNGELLRSVGGAEPSPVHGAPAALTTIDWQPEGPLVGVTRDGAVTVSADGERGWQAVGSVGGPVEALDAGPGRWHVATQTAVLESTDDGATWDVVLEREG
jgi:hypothetical protein